MWTCLAFLAVSGFIAGLHAQVTVFEITCDYANSQILDIVGYTCTLSGLDQDFSHPFYFIRVDGVHLPDHTNADVVNLRIINSEMNRVPSNIFSVFPNVEGFEVNNCGSVTFSFGDFMFAQNVREIIITNNNIPTLGEAPFFFAGNTIEVLILYGNGIVNLGLNPFAGLTNARFVSIGNNQIRTLTPRMMLPLVSIDTFVAYSNNIEQVDGRLFANSPDLEIVNLFGNNITAIGESFLNVNSNLDILMLGGNNCVNRDFTIGGEVDLTFIRESLADCFRNSPWGTQIVLNVVGSLIIYDENEDVIFSVRK